MAAVLWRHATITLTGSAQELSAAVKATPQGMHSTLVRNFWLQPDGGNANAIVVGGPGVTASDYGVYLEAGASTVPPAPWKAGDGELPSGTFSMEGIYVLGTNTQLLHVLWIPIA